jgi:hypothetical protein
MTDNARALHFYYLLYTGHHCGLTGFEHYVMVCHDWAQLCVSQAAIARQPDQGVIDLAHAVHFGLGVHAVGPACPGGCHIIFLECRVTGQ